MIFLKLFTIISLVLRFEYCSGVSFTIGATFDRNKKINLAILEYAVNVANQNILSEVGIELGWEKELLDYGDEFSAAQSVCMLMKGKAFAIIGPRHPSSAAHIASLCDAKEIPFIDTYLDIESKTSTINLYPSQETLSQLLIDTVNEFEWVDFTIIYEAPLYIKRVARLLEDRNNKPGIVTVQPIEVKENFRPVLQKIKDMGSRGSNIIIESSIEYLSDILDQALQVGLFQSDRSFIITNIDAQSIDLSRFQYTQANITFFRILDSGVPFQEFFNIRNWLDEEKFKCKNHFGCSPEEISEYEPIELQTSVALIYDATMILAEALKQIGREHLQSDSSIRRGINCLDSDSVWNKGSTLMNYMKTSNYSGLTGLVEFNTKGLRSNVLIDIMSLEDNGCNKIGVYKPNSEQRLNFLPKVGEVLGDDENRPISEMTFNVAISISAPYVMLKDTTTGLKGNDRFEGFGVDIIDELAQMYGFKYNFIGEENKDYGKYDNSTGLWTGMIGQVMNKTADLAITDLTINSDRISALDFTPSFMNLGIALLYRKPVKEPPKTFSFLAPLSYSVWIYLGAAYITVSLCFFCLGRMSASQWENRYPCVEEPTYLENQFTLNNSLWFAAGALLQQGSEIEPKAASIRLASSFWWFFTLIMVSSYTANLAMFLVVENKTPKIESVDEFANCGEDPDNCKLKFGAKKGGATYAFFKESENPIYQSMTKYMDEHPDYMPNSNDEGIDRVNDHEDYAFLMESSSIEYTTQRKCNLTQIGTPLDDKNYGIGMRKMFQYRTQMNEGILQLQEKGRLTILQQRWWKERKGGGACSDNIDDGQAVPLELASLAGVFYVLIVGTIFAIFYGIITFCMEVYSLTKKHKKTESSDADGLEFQNLKGVFYVLLYGSIFAIFYGCSEALLLIYKRAKTHKVPFKDELKTEIKFLMTCQGVKQARYRKGSKSQYSGTSSRYSGGTNSQAQGSNTLLNNI